LEVSIDASTLRKPIFNAKWASIANNQLKILLGKTIGWHLNTGNRQVLVGSGKPFTRAASVKELLFQEI